MGELGRIFAKPWLPRKEAPTLTREAGALRLQGLRANDLHELLFRLRACEDLEWLLHDARCHSTGAFEAALLRCGLGTFLPAGCSVRVRLDSLSSHLFHEGALEATAKQVLSQRLGFHVDVASEAEHAGPSPGGRSTPGRGAAFEVTARLKENRLRIGVSLTTRTLGRRGYKAALEGKAPLREEQAAACFEALRSGGLWHTQAHTPTAQASKVTAACLAAGVPSPVCYVPFAGTGTLGFEAVLALTEVSLIAPERSFAAMSLPLWSAKTWAHLARKQREACAHAWPPESLLQVTFLESDPLTCEGLRANAEKFARIAHEACGHSPNFEVVHGDFFTWEPPPGLWDKRHVLVPLNPPYGLRLPAARSSYEAIARRLVALRTGPAARAASLRGFLLCPDELSWRQARDALGRAWSHRTTHFTQGGIDVRVLGFEATDTPPFT